MTTESLAQLRGRYRDLLMNLVQDSELTDDLEYSIYKISKQRSSQTSKCHINNHYIYLGDNICEHLQTPDSSLLNVIREGKIPMDEIVDGNLLLWNSEKWSSLAEQQRQLAEIDSKPLVGNTKQYRCSKCKGDNCHVEYRQIRSSDEGYTSFITCLTCGKKWKVNP